jgi:hypothetical protein
VQCSAERAEAVWCRAGAGEKRWKVRTLAKSFASPPLEAILSKAQSGSMCVYAPPMPAQWTNGIESGQAGCAQSRHMHHDHLQQELRCCRRSESINLDLSGESQEARELSTRSWSL